MFFFLFHSTESAQVTNKLLKDLGNKLTKSSSTATANISCQTEQQPLTTTATKQQIDTNSLSHNNISNPYSTYIRQSSANDNLTTISINNNNNTDTLSIATNNSSSSPYISCDNLLNVVKLSPTPSVSVNVVGQSNSNLRDYRPLSALYDIICKEKEYDTMSSFLDKIKDNGGPGGGGGGGNRDEIPPSTINNATINGDHSLLSSAFENYKGHDRHLSHERSQADDHLTIGQSTVGVADVTLDSDLINSRSSCSNNFNNNSSMLLLSTNNYSNTSKLIDRNVQQQQPQQQQYIDEKRHHHHSDMLSNVKNSSSKFEKENDCDIRTTGQQTASNVTGAGVDRFVLYFNNFHCTFYE